MNEKFHYSLDLQGHRGCRGLLPENSIPGFLKAIELGVDTLEMDAVISTDKEVVISHEPFMSHEICLDPQGREFSSGEEIAHNIYKMTLAQIQAYDSGTKVHPRFLRQAKMKTYKPSLSQVVSQVDLKLEELGRSGIHYNIELKIRDEWDGIHHPPYQEFADIAIGKIRSLGILEFTTVQCFHIPTLKYMNQEYPEVKLVFLVDNKKTPTENIHALGYVPFIYSPNFGLVDHELRAYCSELKMKLVPWTVNEITDMERMMEFKVDGIISDFPDILIDLCRRTQEDV